MRKSIILFVIFTLILAGYNIASPNSPQKLISIPGEKTGQYTPPQYNPNKSITYKKPYADLQDEQTKIFNASRGIISH